MRAIMLVLLTAVFLCGLYFVAWWTVPIIGAVYALVRRSRSASLEAALAALLATLILLARQMMMPAFWTLLANLGQIFPLPGIAVVGLTLLLATLLAFTSARVATGVAGVSDARGERR